MKNKRHKPKGSLKSDIWGLYSIDVGCNDGSGDGDGCGFRTGLSGGKTHAQYLYYYLSNTEYRPRTLGDCNPQGHGIAFNA